MMRKFVLTLASMAMFASALAPASAQNGPKVIQRSVILNLEDIGRYWPDPKKEPVYKPAWIPFHRYTNFMIEGPMGSGGNISLEFIKPDGKSWMTIPCRVPLAEGGGLDEGKMADVECKEIDEQKATPITGQFSFKVHYKNELEGVQTELFKGRFKVATYNDKYSKKPYHYINEDWRVPMCYVALDKSNDPDMPHLMTHFWFKHRQLEGDQMTAYLFYNGKKVATNKDMGNSAVNIIDREANLEPLDPKQDYSYQLWKLYFYTVRSSFQNADGYDTSSWHALDQNPGNYEIKLMYNGKLVRVASFVVGEDGQIVAPGTVEKDGDGNQRILIPTKVQGDVDVPWDKNAYKTEVYYGNAGAMTAGVLAP